MFETIKIFKKNYFFLLDEEFIGLTCVLAN